MSCVDYIKINPPPAQGVDQYSFLRDASARDGPLCATKHLTTSCEQQCLSMTKDYEGCFSCLSNTAACSTGFDAAGGKIPCCPNIRAATNCSNCLGLRSRDQLEACLKEKNPRNIIVIVSIVAVAVLIVLSIGLSWLRRHNGATLARQNGATLARDYQNGATPQRSQLAWQTAPRRSVDQFSYLNPNQSPRSQPSYSASNQFIYQPSFPTPTSNQSVDQPSYPDFSVLPYRTYSERPYQQQTSYQQQTLSQTPAYQQTDSLTRDPGFDSISW